MADDKLTLSPNYGAALTRLKGLPKFSPDAMYAGYQPEEHRAAAEALLNSLIDDLISELPAHPSRQYLKQRINDTYAWFELSDTEDRERCAMSLTQIVAAVGVPPSESRISDWLVPFDPVTFANHPHLED